MTFENFAFSQRALEATECSMIPKKNTEQSHSFVAHFGSLKQAMTFEKFTFRPVYYCSQ